MSKKQDMQKIIRYYKDQTGETEVDMKKVAKFAIEKRLTVVPPPIDPVDRLAKQLTQTAREQMRYDKHSGKPYRANHAITSHQGMQQLHFLWIDIDEAPRKHIHKSLIARREQMVGDGLQLTLDADHWNNIHPDEEPIVLPLDFTDDIEWRKNAPDEDKKAA